MAQFEVTRDGGGGSGGAEAPISTPAWRARFAIDIEPFGPVQAEVSLSGQRAGVRLWAERPLTALSLRGRQDLLRSAFEAADYAPQVAVFTGAPPPGATPVGRFVDESS